MRQIKNDMVYTKTVYEKNGVIFRKVDDIESAKQIITALKNKNLMGTCVVNTDIESFQNNLLKHEYIPYILYSGEFTPSMIVDLTELSLNMALDLIDEKIYSWDLMPNNFTFTNGKWLLYDFDAFDTHPKNVKTQIRSMFKISFSSFELTKIIERGKLKHYYLNRIKSFDLYKMISFHNWVNYFFNLQISLLFYSLGLYKIAYFYLRRVYKNYSKNHIKQYYEYNLNSEEKCLYDKTAEILSSKQISSCFCVGENTSKFVFETQNDSINYFLCLDDYNLCDKIYNSIYKNSYKNIIAAVLYPYINEKNIPQSYTYKGLYDSFNQKRFYSDAVIAINADDFVKNNIKVAVKNLSLFSLNTLIISVNKSTNIEEVKQALNNNFEQVVVHTCDNSVLFEASIKKTIENTPKNNKEYKNYSRGFEADAHTKAIFKILKENK